MYLFYLSCETSSLNLDKSLWSPLSGTNQCCCHMRNHGPETGWKKKTSQNSFIRLQSLYLMAQCTHLNYIFLILTFEEVKTNQSYFSQMQKNSHITLETILMMFSTCLKFSCKKKQKKKILLSVMKNWHIFFAPCHFFLKTLQR